MVQLGTYKTYMKAVFLLIFITGMVVLSPIVSCADSNKIERAAIICDVDTAVFGSKEGYENITPEQMEVMNKSIEQEFMAWLYKTVPFEVIDRSYLDLLLKETELSASDLLNPSHSKEIGKLAGIDAIMFFTANLMVDAKTESADRSFGIKIIDVQTGSVKCMGHDSKHYSNMTGSREGYDIVFKRLLDDCLEKYSTAAATSAAKAWLSLIDSGNYSGSWKETSTYYQSAVPEQKWVTALVAVRKPLGKLISRNMIKAQEKTTLLGAPDGKYVVMSFETAFEYKKSVIETVTFMADKEGKWCAAGYVIN